MLKCFKNVSEKNSLGIRVAIIVGSLRECESLVVFESNFKEQIKHLRTGNNLHAETLYRVKFENRFTNNEKLLIVKDKFSKATGKSTDQIIFTITK